MRWHFRESSAEGPSLTTDHNCAKTSVVISLSCFWHQIFCWNLEKKSNFYSSVTVNMKPKVMIHHREIKCEPRRVIPTTQNVRLLPNHCAAHMSPTSVFRVVNPCERHKRTSADCVRCLSPKTNSTLKFRDFCMIFGVPAFSLAGNFLADSEAAIPLTVATL